MPPVLQLAAVLGSLLLQASIHYYLWRRLVKNTGLPAPWRRRATVALVLLAASIPATMILVRVLPPATVPYLALPGLLWLTLSGLMLVGFAGTDLARLLAWLARRAQRLVRRRAGPRAAPAADAAVEAPPKVSRAVPLDTDRREFLGRVIGAAVMGSAVGVTAFGIRRARQPVPVVDVPIRLPRLPTSLDGYAIVQLTDIHVGYTVTRSYVEDLVATANAARPDAVVITGDLVDGTVERLADAVAPLGELAARQGVYFVTGNHEYYAGVEPWLAYLRSLGIRVLRNQRVELGDAGGSFDLAGIDDHDAHRFASDHGADLAGALAGRDSERELVLLAHQPRQVHLAKQFDVGLQLSGHTHGGQVWPWHYLASAQQGGLLAGHSRHRGTQLYVSRGCGYWGPPVRVLAPAEISRVLLRPGSPA